MKLVNKILTHRILSDMRTILFFVAIASVLSSIVAFAAGYERGSNDASDHFISMMEAE